MAAAVLAGIALGPVLIIFPPSYFPWTIVVVALAGLLVGIASGSRSVPAQLARSIAAALTLFVVAILTFGRPTTGSFSPVLFAVLWWLFVPMAAGAVLGGLARRRLGPLRALAVTLGGAGELLLVGAVVALAAAPVEVADAPRCEPGRECSRSACWMTAERRRWLGLERVTSYRDGAITCVYTGWGGLHIGTVDAGGRGSTWEDGWWPKLVRTWTP